MQWYCRLHCRLIYRTLLSFSNLVCCLIRTQIPVFAMNINHTFQIALRTSSKFIITIDDITSMNLLFHLVVGDKTDTGTTKQRIRSISSSIWKRFGIESAGFKKWVLYPCTMFESAPEWAHTLSCSLRNKVDFAYGPQMFHLVQVVIIIITIIKHTSSTALENSSSNNFNLIYCGERIIPSIGWRFPTPQQPTQPNIFFCRFPKWFIRESRIFSPDDLQACLFSDPLQRYGLPRWKLLFFVILSNFCTFLPTSYFFHFG